jgi:hypothetical protein
LDYLLPDLGHCSQVFGIRNMLKPRDRDTIHRFLDGNMRHRAIGTRSVPVALPRVKDDDIPGCDSFDWTAIALNPAKAIGNDEKLTKRMRMPSSASTSGKRDLCTAGAGWLFRLRVPLDADTTGKPLCRPNPDNAIARSNNFHVVANVWQMHNACCQCLAQTG